MLMLAGVLVASVWVAPSLHAGIIYTAGNETIVDQNGNVGMPIIVSSDLTAPGDLWGNASFNLTWDPSVVHLRLTTPVDFAVSPLPLGLSNFNSPSLGQLNFSWTASDYGNTVDNNSTLFTVYFTAVGGPFTAVSFHAVANIGINDSSGKGYDPVTPTWSDGSVTVVPEPVNWALGLFACVFIGGATVRWISNRRMALQSA